MALSRSAQKRREAKKIARGKRALEAYRARVDVASRMAAWKAQCTQTVELTVPPSAVATTATISFQKSR